MIPHRADLTFDEILEPSVRWCKSGHDIPEGMKVYSVGGPSLQKSRWGQYCELCVAGARHLANIKKAKEKAPQLEEEEPIDPNMLKIQLKRIGFTGGIAEETKESSKESWEEFVEKFK